MTWKQTSGYRYEREDGCVVKYDETVNCNTARPWLPNHRGWMAYGPGDIDNNYLGFFKKNSRFRIPKKYKTPEAAIKAVESEFPSK